MTCCTKIYLCDIVYFYTVCMLGPFTHSIENADIEALSTFHRSFIEIFVVMQEFFDNATNFSWKYTFRKFLKKKYN